MAYQDPNEPYRTSMSDEEIRRQARLNEMDSELQPDPELSEGRAGGTRIAMFAIAIAVVLGAVFYGLNNSSINQAGTTPPAQTAQQTSPTNPAAPTGANTEPGTTTGAATNRPTPPQPGPTGQEIDRSATPNNGAAPNDNK